LSRIFNKERSDTFGCFVARAKDAARRADHGQPFENKITLAFEDPQRMFLVLSEARRRLMLEVILAVNPVLDTKQALHGVSSPFPESLKFLNDQGRWFTPFTHPGMTGPYDLRGWHVEPTPAAEKK
jgi:hypothetical protein